MQVVFGRAKLYCYCIKVSPISISNAEGPRVCHEEVGESACSVRLCVCEMCT